MIDAENLRGVADEMLSGMSADDAMKSRIQFRASVMDRLPAISGEMLSGLHATAALRHRILVASARRERSLMAPVLRVSTASKRPSWTRAVPAMAMGLALTLMISLGAMYKNGLTPTTQSAGNEAGISTYMAGAATGTNVPQYRTLYAGTDSVTPPIVLFNNRYYRMLNSPASVPQSLLSGIMIAEVQTYTAEPTLAASVGVVSNVAQAGAKVYAVNGLSQKTACVVEVDGALRLFQRVGYASEALVGKEMFSDTLDIYGQVATLELSGVGIITDESKANEIIAMLAEFATYHSDEIAETGQALTIYLKNGLSLQLIVDGDVLSGCGAWECPGFQKAFALDMDA